MITVVGTSQPKDKVTVWGVHNDGKAQWVVSCLVGKPGKVQWSAKSFVGSNKDILRRVLREHGVTVSESGERYLASLPERWEKP